MEIGNTRGVSGVLKNQNELLLAKLAEREGKNLEMQR